MTQEHPHMEAVRMEAAIEVLGVKVARIGDVLAEERAKPDPDQARIATLLAKTRELRDLQDDLFPGDPRIDEIRLEPEGQ